MLMGLLLILVFDERTNDERSCLSIHQRLRIKECSAFRLTGETGESDLDLDRDLQQDKTNYCKYGITKQLTEMTIAHLVSEA